jgi:hypothetical protein
LQFANSSLALSVNRLSGDLPSSSFGKYVDLDILSGNLFGCSHLPKNDENSGSLSCGSEQYDQSMMMMGGVLGLMLCLIGIYHLLSLFLSSSSSSSSSSLKSQSEKTKLDHRITDIVDSKNLLRYVRYYDSQSNPEAKDDTNSPSPPNPLQSTISFGSLLSRLMWSSCVLTVLCFVLSLPIYVLKELDVESGSDGGGEGQQYVTHSHMYDWLWTMAFVSGTTPAIILMLTGLICLSYFNVVMNRLGAATEGGQTLSDSPPVAKDQHLSRTLTVWTIFLLNIVVVGTVNGLYIWSTLLDIARDVRIWIQISFALFSFVWSVVLRVGLPLRLKESRYGVWLFICLNVTNTVLIPCIVTALSTPSCYQVSALLLLLSLIFDHHRTEIAGPS